MVLGLGLGRAVPGLDDALAEVEAGGISLPIALGLLVMMYPVLAKVRYDPGSTPSPATAASWWLSTRWQLHNDSSASSATICARSGSASSPNTSV